MSSVARHDDIGTGFCDNLEHPGSIPMVGVIIPGPAPATKTIVEGKLVARVGDIVLGACGHIGIITTGSSTMNAEGQPVARVGDAFVGDFKGIITKGSSTTDVA